MSSESQTTVECPSCDGTGQFWQNGSPWRCNGCHGTGRLPIEDQPDKSQTTSQATVEISFPIDTILRDAIVNLGDNMGQTLGIYLPAIARCWSGARRAASGRSKETVGCCGVDLLCVSVNIHIGVAINAAERHG